MRKELISALVLFAVGLSTFTTEAAEPATFKVGGVTFERPKTFKWVDITPGMRAAELKVEGEGKDAEVVFFNFPAGVGGGVQANVDRWLGMFKEPKDQIKAKTEKVSKGKSTITYVQAEGTYMSGMPGRPKTAEPGAMLQGAIVETPQSNIFVRMTGPAEIVKKSRKDFRAMIEAALE